MGEGLIQERIKKTLLLMDSHVKSINARKIEQHIGGLLFTGQVARDRRIYNSGPWENAKFPMQNLQERIIPLTKERNYSAVIIQGICNDLTNAVTHVKDTKTLFRMAQLSSENVVSAAEKALKSSPYIRKILILPRSPRSDSELLCDLTNYANDWLTVAIGRSGCSKIKLGSMDSIPRKTSQDLYELFGNDMKTDKIHLRGPKGKQLYTEAILDSLRRHDMCIV